LNSLWSSPKKKWKAILNWRGHWERIEMESQNPRPSLYHSIHFRTQSELRFFFFSLLNYSKKVSSLSFFLFFLQSNRLGKVAKKKGEKGPVYYTNIEGKEGGGTAIYNRTPIRYR
jgi:hypothetical protein